MQQTTNAPRGCGWWLVRILVGFVGLILICTLAGCAYQLLAEANDARQHPPPGQMVDVGGYQLHLKCTGEGSPTVILEAFSGGNSSEWGWVQPEVAKVTRVCSYDRAGRAWSEESGQPQTLNATATTLHTLLANAGVAGPYILVGHSIGGLYVREFQSQYPDEVSGIVLVDSSHPQQLERFPEWDDGDDAYLSSAAVFDWLTRMGTGHLYFALGGEIDFAGLPKREHDELVAVISSSRYVGGQRAEVLAGAGLFKDAQQLGTLGDLPLIVITAGQNTLDGWKSLQDELATLSTDSVHETILEATHASLAFDEAPAKRVSELIVGMVEKVRDSSGQ